MLLIIGCILSVPEHHRISASSCFVSTTRQMLTGDHFRAHWLVIKIYSVLDKKIRPNKCILSFFFFLRFVTLDVVIQHYLLLPSTYMNMMIINVRRFHGAVTVQTTIFPFLSNFCFMNIIINLLVVLLPDTGFV